MADIVIQPLAAANQGDLNRCDNSFMVEAELCLRAEDGRISYSVGPVTPYVKRYGPEIYDPRPYIERDDHAAWLAYVDDQLAGQILVHENRRQLQLEVGHCLAVQLDAALFRPGGGLRWRWRPARRPSSTPVGRGRSGADLPLG